MDFSLSWLCGNSGRGDGSILLYRYVPVKFHRLQFFLHGRPIKVSPSFGTDFTTTHILLRQQRLLIQSMEPTPKTITLNGASANPVKWSTPFFTTDALAAGEHTLQIVYNGNAASTPLSVQALIVNGGTLSTLVTTSPSSGSSINSVAPASSSLTTTATLSGTSSSQSALVNLTAISTLAGGSLTTVTTEVTATSVPLSSQESGSLTTGSASPGSTSSAADLSNAHGSKTNVGAIAGGVVAGILFLLLLVVVSLFLRRRRRTREGTQQPFEPVSGEANTPNEIFSQIVHPYPPQSQSDTSRVQYTNDSYPSYLPEKTASRTQLLSANAHETDSDLDYRTPQTLPPRYST